jgi:hypothetical protein
VPRKRKPPDAPAPSSSQPHVVSPDAVYTVGEFQAALKLTRSTVRREVKAKRLRVAKRAGKYFLLGKWILEWLEGGEHQPKAQPADRNGSH